MALESNGESNLSAPHPADTPAHQEELLTRAEVAAYLKVKPQTLAVWASTKRYDLPMIKVGRSVRYRADDVRRFLQTRTVGGQFLRDGGLTS